MFVLVGFCNTTAPIALQVPGGPRTPISIPGPTPDGTSTSRRVIVSVLTGLVGTLVTVILHDLLSSSQPAATSRSQGVPSEKTDKSIMDVYEHISRLSRRIVSIDNRLARWEKKMKKT
jgi:hypothetical protein